MFCGIKFPAFSSANEVSLQHKEGLIDNIPGTFYSLAYEAHMTRMFSCEGST